MQRKMIFTLIILLMAGPIVLHMVKYYTRGLEKQSYQLTQELQNELAAKQILEAEWVYLNQPSRIQHLAEHYLAMRPVAPDQIATLDQLEVLQNYVLNNQDIKGSKTNIAAIKSVTLRPINIRSLIAAATN